MSQIPVSAELLELLINAAEHGTGINTPELMQARQLLASPQDSAGAVGEMRLSALVEGLVIPVVEQELPVGTKLYTTPQPAGPAVEVAGEREAFEAWCRNELDVPDTYELDIHDDHVHLQCRGWKAGAAWQRTQSAGRNLNLEISPEWVRKAAESEQGHVIAAGVPDSAAQQPNPDVARLREALDEVRNYIGSQPVKTSPWRDGNRTGRRLEDGAMDTLRILDKIDAALAQTSGGEKP